MYTTKQVNENKYLVYPGEHVLVRRKSKWYFHLSTIEGLDTGFNTISAALKALAKVTVSK